MHMAQLTEATVSVVQQVETSEQSMNEARVIVSPAKLVPVEVPAKRHCLCAGAARCGAQRLRASHRRRGGCPDNKDVLSWVQSRMAVWRGMRRAAAGPEGLRPHCGCIAVAAAQRRRCA